MENRLVQRATRSTWVRYSFAVAAALAGLLIRLPAANVLGDKVPYITFFLATAVSATFGGFGPGILTTALGAVLAGLFVVPHYGSLVFTDPVDYLGLLLFLGVGTFISHLAGRLIRASQHESALRTLFERTLVSIGDAVISTDETKRVRLVNPAAELLTGWKQEEAKGKPIEEVFRIVREGSDVPAENPIEKVLTTGTVVGLANHTELITKDGRRVPIDDSGAPIKDVHGAIAGAVLVFRDISQRRTAERAVEKAEQRSREILESITDAFVVFDLNWRIKYINPAGEKIVGRSSETLVGKDHWEEFPDAVGTEIERSYRRAVAENVQVHFEVRYEPLEKWFELHVYPASEEVAVYFRDITERKNSEVSLRESEAKFRLLTESLPQLVWTCLPDGRCDYLSRQWIDYTGLPESDQLDLNWLDQVIHPDDRERTREHWFGAVAGQHPYDIEFRIRRTDGAYRWFQTRGVPLHDDQGIVIKWFGTCTDITHLKEVEDRNHFLMRLDDAVRPLTEPAEITQAAARLLGHHLSANRCAYADVEADEDTFNLTGDYTNGVDSIVGRYTFTQFGAECLRLMREGQPYVVSDSETDPRTLEVRSSYQKTEIRSVICVSMLKQGRFVAAMAVHQKTPRDWHPDEIELVQQIAARCWESIERARIARELEQRGQRYRFLAESIPQMVWTADAQGALDYVNGQVTQYFDTESSVVLGNGWLGWVHSEDQEQTVERWKKSLETGEAYEALFRLKRGSDESWRWHLVRALPLVAAQGKVSEWFGTCTDIHDQKEGEEALRLANRELEEFAYAASHDLQEPLRMINIYGQMLIRRFAQGDEKAAEYGRFIQEGITRMETLLRDLLAYSQATHREERTKVEAADLSASLAEAKAVLGTRIEETGAVIVSDPMPTVLGEAGQLAHVFQNLLSNALKCRTDSPPQIHIEARSDADTWTISVRDNGIGFEQQYAEQIFRLFKRLHKNEYPGTGLGLAICQRIVERYGGRMWAESKLGQGATFFFSLPKWTGQ